MVTPSTEELDLRSRLDASIGRAYASLSRCPMIDPAQSHERLVEADAIIDAVELEIASAQSIAATLERLVGVTEEAMQLGGQARLNLEVARTALTLLRAELDYRLAA